MGTGILAAVGVGLTWAGIGIVYSRIARDGADFPAFMAVASVVLTAAAWAAMPCYGGLATASRVGRLAMVMAVAGVLCSAGTLLMQEAMRRGHHAASWTIGQSALVWPFVAGVLVFGDRLTVPRVAGVGCILAALVAFGRTTADTAADVAADDRACGGGSWAAPAFGAFALLGLEQVLTLAPSNWDGWIDAARLRAPLLLTGSMSAYVVVAVVTRRRPARWMIVPSVLMVLLVLPSQRLLFVALDRLSAVECGGIAYPVAIGTCVVGFALYSVAFLRERFRAAHWIGLALGVVGMGLVAA